mmetsp:Transcript_97745/g.143055  ORF Transcript_97745/g.143055 Transcript_97745/m.143055 type:complete len:250 (+) Transcript_97745:175-924(+)
MSPSCAASRASSASHVASATRLGVGRSMTSYAKQPSVALAPSPTKWRYVREVAFQSLSLARCSQHMMARVVRSWSTHVRAASRSLALWLTGRHARRVRYACAARVLAQLRLACHISRARYLASIRYGWEGMCSSIAASRQLSASRCINLWMSITNTRTRNRRMCRRFRSRRIRRICRAWLGRLRKGCLLVSRLLRVVVRRDEMRRVTLFLSWRRQVRNETKVKAVNHHRQIPFAYSSEISRTKHKSRHT